MNQYIELISEGKTGDFRYAVLDFDGTISLIREGWQQIMTPYLASGTDEVYVLEEARLLKVDRFFGKHIYGGAVIAVSREEHIFD